MKRLWICLVLVFTLFPGLNVYAAEPSSAVLDYQEQLEAIGADELQEQLPEGARGLLENTGIQGVDYQAILSLSPGEFFRQLFLLAKAQIRKPVALFGTILGALLLCALLDGFKTALWKGPLSGTFNAVAVATVAAAIAPPILECVTSTVQAIQDCSRFIAAFIPVFSSILTVSGQPVTATTYTLFLFAACQVVSQIVSSTLVPLMGIYLALCVTGSLIPGTGILPVAKTVKSVVSWGLGLLLTLFVGLLSLQTMVASGSDTVAAKTAKFLIGSFVPVVGSALSDAFIATQGYLRLLKTAVGAFGALAAAATFLPVFLQTAGWYLMVNLSASVSEMLGIQQTADLLKSTSATLGILLSVTLCFAILVVVSTSLVLIVSMGG